MNFKEYLEKQSETHPSIQMQDIVKMCFQAVYGPEHLLSDPERAKNYFMQEYEATPADSSIPLYEPVSGTFCRVNLAAWKAAALNPDQLFDLFFASAQGKASGTDADFNFCIKEAEQLITNGMFPFSPEEWADYYASYQKDGIHPVHHSDAYRLAERPAYRLVCVSLLKAALPE